MKLLFDQNLAPRLVSSLHDLFPDSAHVDAHGLGTASDQTVWKFAIEHGFALVSKDADFVDRSIQFGAPPKVISITLGNCTTAQVESLFRMRFAAIESFDRDTEAALLFLP